ncbi:MAG: putative porin [Candidatus Omnitrophica bacterium]|nr:putative porin [Candidatus Omnitrophota bacterium]
MKEPGDWKARMEYRYIGRDAIPDFMPDSDFYGFGTFTSNTVALNANNNGLPMEGGTNGKGINLAFEYQLLKNTALNIEYYWMKPIKSWDKTNPWNELQMDVVTKF